MSDKRCEKFQTAIDNGCIDTNFDETYDISEDVDDSCGGFDHTEYMTILYCPFCGEEL